MATLIHDLDPLRVAENLASVRERIATAARVAGRDPAAVELCAAVKYVALEQLGILVAAGIELVGENRAQELERKSIAYPELTWDFIGRLQSRKVRALLPRVRLLHSVATDSALRELGRHADERTEVLIEVNIADEDGKPGIDPQELDAFIGRCPVRVGGLMAMPPATDDAERSRRHFSSLRELAERHGLQRLSMGTSQDFEVAVQEGATIVRIGTNLYR